MNDVNDVMREAMIEHIRRGSKPREEWRTGLELELIGYKVNGGNALNGLITRASERFSKSTKASRSSRVGRSSGFEDSTAR